MKSYTFTTNPTTFPYPNPIPSYRLWGWFDVGNANFPPPLDITLVTTLFSILDSCVGEGQR